MKTSHLTPALFAMLLFGTVVLNSSEPVEHPKSSDKMGALDSYEGRDGTREAKAALREGRLVVLRYGQPAVWVSDYQRILRERYQIEVRTIAGCIVSEGLLAYARDYNAVMRPVIAERFGADVFDKVAKEAETMFLATQVQPAGQGRTKSSSVTR
jgi:hypothetical protein